MSAKILRSFKGKFIDQKYHTTAIREKMATLVWYLEKKQVSLWLCVIHVRNLVLRLSWVGVRCDPKSVDSKAPFDAARKSKRIRAEMFKYEQG